MATTTSNTQSDDVLHLLPVCHYDRLSLYYIYIYIYTRGNLINTIRFASAHARDHVTGTGKQTVEVDLSGQ